MKAWVKPILKAAGLVLGLVALAAAAVAGWVLWMVSQLPH